MRILLPSTIITALCLAACGGESDDNDNKPAESSATATETTEKADSSQDIVALVPTSFLTPPENIIRASISPKPGLQTFGSKILLLSESGKLYAGGTGFAPVEELLEGPFRDVQGLSLGFEPAAFLTLTDTGELKAYQENDQGVFKSVPLNTPEELTGNFCGTFPATPDLFVMEVGGVPTRILYQMEAGALSLSLGEALDNPDLDCQSVYELQSFEETTQDKPFDPSSVFDDDYADTRYTSYELALENGQLTHIQDKKTTVFSIESGLSMEGLAKVDWFYATNTPLGNTFSKGAVLMGNRSENRVIMISMEYLMGQLEP